MLILYITIIIIIIESNINRCFCPQKLTKSGIYQVEETS